MNWKIFGLKYDKRETWAFEQMSYLLFCAEFNNRIGLFRYKNQTGIETEPIEKDGKCYGFQSKYYTTSITSKKEDIIDSIKKAKSKNKQLSELYLYINQELSESTTKSKKPQYQLDIEKAANTEGINIQWRVPSHFELQLSLPDNKYINDIFFSLDPNEGDLHDEISPTALECSVRSELKGLLKIQDEENATVFFIDTVKRKPILCRSCNFEDKSYIIGVYEKESHLLGKTQHLCVLNMFANKWQIFHNEQLDEFECYPEVSDNCELIIHNKKIYFYFERLIQQIGTMFQGMGVAEFAVFDFDKKTISKLLYQGIYRNGGIDGEFDFEFLEQMPNTKVYEFILEQEASKSKYIYRTPKNYNLDEIENYIEKWNVENSDFYNNENGLVSFFTYDESILWDIKRYGNIEYYKVNTNHVENGNYLIFFYFAGPIIAMRKLDNKYFVVLVPQSYGTGGAWGLRSIKSVDFLTNKKILAKNDYESYEIDLETGEYTRIYF